MSDFSTDVSTTSVTDLSKRVRYSTGLVLGVDEFEQEQAYFIERDRLLTRALHGYGVVQGLSVDLDFTGELPKIVVGPGVAVTPEGQHVCVEREQCAVINDWLAAQSTDLIDGDSGELCISVVLRYGTCATDFVPVPGEPCRSADDARVASRLDDDFSLVLEPASDRPPHVEEHAVRLLGELFRAMEVREDGRPVRRQAVKDLVAAVPDAAFSVGDDGTVSANADAGFDDVVAAADVDGAAGLVKEADGGPLLRVQPGRMRRILEMAETTWITRARRAVLHAGRDEDADPLRAGDGGHTCQPVPEGDDGVVLSTVCLDVRPLSNGGDGADGGLEEVPDTPITLSTGNRPQLLSTRVLQETRSGALDRVRPASGDGGPDDTLRGETASGDLTGTYPSPQVAGLRGTSVRDMDADEISQGMVLTWNSEARGWEPAGISHPDPEVPEPDVQTNLTRIVATSWTHGARYADPKALQIDLEGPRGDTKTLPALAVAFGTKDTVLGGGLDLDGPGRVEQMDVTPEVFRAFLELEVNEFTGMGAPGLASRVRLRAQSVFPLTSVTLEDTDRGPKIVQAKVAEREQQTFARGAVLVLPDSFTDVLPQAIRGRVEVDVRGEFLTDEEGRAVDGTFVNTQLPTGQRPDTDGSGSLGVQGGRFESWFYARLDTDDLVDLNTAGREELMILPNVGSVIADRIVTYRRQLREERGLTEGEPVFNNAADLDAVQGLSIDLIRDWEGLVKPALNLT